MSEPTEATARAKLRRIFRGQGVWLDGMFEPCTAGCPGWAVFDSGGEFILSRCDECWSGQHDPLTDDEVELLPEAQNELALINADGDAYVYPVASTQCVACGLNLWRPLDAQHAQCCGCGAVTPPRISEETQTEWVATWTNDTHILVAVRLAGYVALAMSPDDANEDDVLDKVTGLIADAHGIDAARARAAYRLALRGVLSDHERKPRLPSMQPDPLKKKGA